jgi:hypothetical protein
MNLKYSKIILIFSVVLLKIVLTQSNTSPYGSNIDIKGCDKYAVDKKANGCLSCYAGFALVEASTGFKTC